MTGKDGPTKTAEYGAVFPEGTDAQQAADGEEQSAKPDGTTEEVPDTRAPRDSSGDMIAVQADSPLARAEGAATDGATDEAADVPPDPEAELRDRLEKKQNQLLRVAADFDNFKKRCRRDAQEAAFRARNDVLTELLPVIDNLELALAHVAEGEAAADTKSLHDGVNMVLRQFHAVMERFEVKALDALGQPFDPAFHEALQQRETDEYPPGVVMEEFRRGYMMGDRLIRPAMVVVAKAPEGAAGGGENPEKRNGGEGDADGASETDSATPGQGEG
ncbi:MAG: nucleotide exchange factor GrpE [bacterium]